MSSAVLKAAWSSLPESAGIPSKQMEERASDTEAEVRLEQARQTAAVSSEGSRRTRQGNSRERRKTAASSEPSCPQP